jgi:hypothetical protein
MLHRFQSRSTVWPSTASMVWRRMPVAACGWVCILGAAVLTPGHGAQLRLTVLDSDAGKPVPCRIHLKDAAGQAVRPKGAPFWHDQNVRLSF